MKQLSKTSTDDGHFHIVYLNDEDGVGYVSQANDGHIHEIEFSEEGWLLYPHPDDQHYHQLEAYEDKKPRRSQSKEDAVVEVIQLYKIARELEQEARDAGKESESFYCGDHWDHTEKSKLQALDRAALTINHIEKDIDQLSGYHREQRSDFRFIPIEGGDQIVADILNIIVKRALEDSEFFREESKVFEDQAITGRGFYHVFVTHEEDPRGQIKVKRFKWERVYVRREYVQPRKARTTVSREEKRTP
jgi:hypothetical protein